MPVAFPDDATVNLHPPDAAEAQVLSRGVLSAVAPPDGPTELQSALTAAVVDAMTGHPMEPGLEPITPREFAERLATRRTGRSGPGSCSRCCSARSCCARLPREVAAQVQEFAAELGVDDGMLRVAQEFAAGTLGLAALDFDRNGYTSDWADGTHEALHTAAPLADAWEQSVRDPQLAARWCGLETLPEGTLGRRVADFYRARGFVYPGHPGSAPPLLAQHDWVHVLADYGTRVESELEVFAFIARANDDPRAFSLLAMVVSLFETGYLRSGAGLFESSPGQLSRAGVATRVADAMRTRRARAGQRRLPRRRLVRGRPAAPRRGPGPLRA